MSKKEIFKSLLLGSLVMATLMFGSFKANASDVNLNSTKNLKSLVSAKQF